MGEIYKCNKMILFLICVLCFSVCSCTVKAVGDPDRPITINAHIILDIKGMESTATDIEDFVSGKVLDQKFSE